MFVYGRDEYEILYRTIMQRSEKIGVKSNFSSRRTIDLECVPEKYRNIVLDEGTLAPIYFSKSGDPNWGPLLEIVGSNVLLKSVAISDIYEEFGAGLANSWCCYLWSRNVTGAVFGAKRPM